MAFYLPFCTYLVFQPIIIVHPVCAKYCANPRGYKENKLQFMLTRADGVGGTSNRQAITTSSE